MSDERRITPHPDAVLRRVGDGAILVHLGSGDVYELNDTAARAWELVATGRSASEIVSQLVAEYNGPGDAIGEDVHELFAFLARHNLLTS